MSLTRNHAPSQHVSNSTTDEILPPDPKRRRLSGPRQDENENEHRNQYGPTILNDSSRAIVGNVYETHNHFNPPSPQSEQEKSKCLRDSLAFKRMDARLHNVRAALRNTCEWLFRHRTFKEWIDDSKLSEHKGFLWLKGKPGCGKSTLMKGAYHWAKARAKKQCITLSYFFNARAPGVLEKSPLGLYRSLVHEILRVATQSIGTFDDMFSWKDPTDDAAWTIEELQQFLLNFVESDNRLPIVIFIDALDEGDERDIRALISFLEDLIDHSHKDLPIRICLSSRHYPHITIRTGLSLIVENQAEHGRDIEKYVRGKLLDAASPETSPLCTIICERSASIFLWVVLVVPILNQIRDQGKSVADMTTYLEQLPKDLEGLFAEILARDAAELRSCVSLLQWVLYSNTPLNSIELYLAIQHSWRRPEEEVITVPNRDILAKYLLHHSRGLVEVTKSEPPVVQFIHETVREFLAGDHGLAQVDPALAGNLPGWTHAKLTQTCLSYFCRSCLQSDLSRHSTSLESLKRKVAREAKIRELVPFLPYVMANLMLHAEAAQRYGIPQRHLLDNLQTDDGNIDPNYVFAYNFCQEHRVRYYELDMTILYIVTERCLPALTSLVLSTSGDLHVNSKCGRYGNALQAACYGGNEDIVRSLLTRGANVNMSGGEYKSALGAAIAARHFHLFALLKTQGVRKHGAMSAKVLDWVGRPNLKEDVRELFRLGIGPYLPENSLHSGLVAATGHPDIELMELFLQNGADVDYAAWKKPTPLMIAAAKGSREAVNVLLSRGASPNKAIYSGKTPLHEAAEHGHEQIVEMLLDKGAEVNFEGSGALQAAVKCGSEQLVQLLLDRGADVNLGGDPYGSALSAACNHNDAKMARLLLDRGANVNVVRWEGRETCNRALPTASECGHREIIQMLLDNGANVNSRTSQSIETALYAASRTGRVEIVQMLLDNGADMNVTTGGWGSALIAASFMEEVEIVQMLLDRGADVNAEGPGGTALQLATRYGRQKIVDMLIAAGAHR